MSFNDKTVRRARFPSRKPDAFRSFLTVHSNSDSKNIGLRGVYNKSHLNLPKKKKNVYKITHQNSKLHYLLYFLHVQLLKIETPQFEILKPYT